MHLMHLLKRARMQCCMNVWFHLHDIVQAEEWTWVTKAQSDPPCMYYNQSSQCPFFFLRAHIETLSSLILWYSYKWKSIFCDSPDTSANNKKRRLPLSKSLQGVPDKVSTEVRLWTRTVGGQFVKYNRNFCTVLNDHSEQDSGWWTIFLRFSQMFDITLVL